MYDDVLAKTKISKFGEAELLLQKTVREFSTEKLVAVIVAIVLGIMKAFLSVMYAKISSELGTMAINQVNYAGGVLLALVLSPEPIVRLYSKRQITVDSFKWWMSLGPVLGIFSTTLLGIASAQLIDNLILISLSYNVGLLCSATFTDHVGFLGSPKYSIGPLKVGALLLFLGGLVFFSVENNRLEFRPFTLVCVLSGFVDNLGCCFNRRGSDTFRYKPQATLVNYVGGCVVVLVMSTGYSLIDNEPSNRNSLPWYYYSTFIIVFGLVFGAFYFGPKIGLCFFSMIVILVDTCISLVLTTQLSENARALTWWMVCGLILSLAAVILAGVAQRLQEHSDDAALKKDDLLPLKDIDSVSTVTTAADSEGISPLTTSEANDDSSPRYRSSAVFRDSYGSQGGRGNIREAYDTQGRRRVVDSQRLSSGV